MNDKTAHWIARHLPKRLVMWCFIVVTSYATTGEYGRQIVPDLTAMDALERYSHDNGLDGQKPKTGDNNE